MKTAAVIAAIVAAVAAAPSDPPEQEMPIVVPQVGEQAKAFDIVTPVRVRYGGKKEPGKFAFFPAMKGTQIGIRFAGADGVLQFKTTDYIIVDANTGQVALKQFGQP